MSKLHFETVVVHPGSAKELFGTHPQMYANYMTTLVRTCGQRATATTPIAVSKMHHPREQDYIDIVTDGFVRRLRRERIPYQVVDDMTQVDVPSTLPIWGHVYIGGEYHELCVSVAARRLVRLPDVTKVTIPFGITFPYDQSKGWQMRAVELGRRVLTSDMRQSATSSEICLSKA